MYTDKLTKTLDRISFARILVEIDIAKELVRSIEIELPSGKVINQPIHYEFVA